jgi:hypothetical protein
MFHDPLRVAEEFALLDLTSDGGQQVRRTMCSG